MICARHLAILHLTSDVQQKISSQFISNGNIFTYECKLLKSELFQSFLQNDRKLMTVQMNYTCYKMDEKNNNKCVFFFYFFLLFREKVGRPYEHMSLGCTKVVRHYGEKEPMVRQIIPMKLECQPLKYEKILRGT